MKILKIFLMSVAGAVGCSCSGASSASSTAGGSSEDVSTVQSPRVNADSVYKFVAEQVAFGPRVPGTPAHRACGAYLAGKLRQYGVDVIEQRAMLSDITGRQFEAVNIYGRINPEAKRRVLLVAHWDTRPWADEDSNPANHTRPIDGANDGASGVAAIIEMARVMQGSLPEVGVDILLTDAEDSGKSAPTDASAETIMSYEDSWCLGTQHWLDSNPYATMTRPAFAILLDMVGGKDAVFPVEFFSHRYAREYVDKLLAASRIAGTERRFPNTVNAPINDDHVHLNRHGIPAIDIIETTDTGFNPTWHTMADNLDNIDRTTMADVANTVLTLIYNEKQ